MPTAQILTEREQKKYFSLDDEARRLLEFKKENIRKNRLTPCPECATWINLKARKCPQCTSDISAHTQKVQEQLKKLDEISAELYELHKKKMELYHEGTPYKPIWERVQTFFTDKQLLQDFKIVIPTLVSFFALLFFLKSQDYGILFWLAAIGGGTGLYFLFKRWNLKKFIVLDLYRTALVFGLVILLTATLFSKVTVWPAKSGKQTAVITAPSANLRESPSTSADVVATVQQGERVTVTGKRGSWYKVKTENRKRGWIHAELVSAQSS